LKGAEAQVSIIMDVKENKRRRPEERGAAVARNQNVKKNQGGPFERNTNGTQDEEPTDRGG